MRATILLFQRATDAVPLSSAGSELLLYVKLMAVLGLILALAIVGIRVVLPRLAGVRKTTEGLIQVAACYPLEPRKNLYVIRVGAEFYLVGTTESGMQFLAALDGERIGAALEGDALPQREISAVLRSFRNLRRSS